MIIRSTHTAIAALSIALLCSACAKHETASTVPPEYQGVWMEVSDDVVTQRKHADRIQIDDKVVVHTRYARYDPYVVTMKVERIIFNDKELKFFHTSPVFGPQIFLMLNEKSPLFIRAYEVMPARPKAGLSASQRYLGRYVLKTD